MDTTTPAPTDPKADIERRRQENDSLGKSILQKLGYKNENRLPNGNVKGGQSGWKIRFNIKSPTGRNYFNTGNKTLENDKHYNEQAQKLVDWLNNYFGTKSKGSVSEAIKGYKLYGFTNEHPSSIWKFLSGGEQGESDFTIYIGSADDVLKFVEDVKTSPIANLLVAGNQGSDVNVTSDGIFKARIEGASIGFSGYGAPTDLNIIIGNNDFTFIFNGKRVNINYGKTKNLSDISITVEGGNKQGVNWSYKVVGDDNLKKDFPELYKNIRNIIGFQLYGDYLQGSNNEFLKLTGVDKINAKYNAEYIDKVKKGEFTAQQAKDALKEINRLTPELSKQIDDAELAVSESKTTTAESDIEKQKEKVKEELLNKKVKTKTGLVLRIIDVKLNATADNVMLFYVSESDNKHNSISYSDFTNALEDGKIMFIPEKTEVVEPAKKEVKKELVLSQDEINNISKENKKIINVPEQDSVESGEVVAAIINPANGKTTPTNSKFKVVNLGFIKMIDITLSPEVILFGNHVAELRNVGINSEHDLKSDTTTIDGEDYALAEGYASWGDYFIENKKVIDSITQGKSKRVMIIVEPIGVKTKERISKGKKDLLNQYGFTDSVINAMTDAELVQAIEAANNEDVGVLNMMLFNYEKLILPESKTVEQVESEMNDLFTRVMTPEFNDDITDFKNYLNDLIIEIESNVNYLIGNNASQRIENLYKDLETKIKNEPLFKNIMKNDVVTIDNTEYVAETISADSITFAMLGDVTVKLKVKENEIPTKVQSISEPIGRVFEEDKVNVTSTEKGLIKSSVINEKQLEVTNAILQNKNVAQAKEDSDFKKKC